MNLITSAILIVTTLGAFILGSIPISAQNPVTKVVIKRKLVTTTVIKGGKVVHSSTEWFIEVTCRTGNKSTLKTLTTDEYIDRYFDDVHREAEKGVSPVVSGKSKIVTENDSRTITDEMTIQTTLYDMPCR